MAKYNIGDRFKPDFMDRVFKIVGITYSNNTYYYTFLNENSGRLVGGIVESYIHRRMIKVNSPLVDFIRSLYV